MQKATSHLQSYNQDNNSNVICVRQDSEVVKILIMQTWPLWNPWHIFFGTNMHCEMFSENLRIYEWKLLFTTLTFSKIIAEL